MNVISLDAARKRKQHKKLMITIPIITRIYEEDGEIKFEVAGEKDVPLEMLENNKKRISEEMRFFIFLHLNA